MEPLVKTEKALAALIDAVENYMADQRPSTYDALEEAMNAAKRELYGGSK